MDQYIKEVQLRWSDLDPNFHLRHSVYYDWAAFARIEFLNACGLTPAVMTQLKFGPILFREECVFKKEIRLGDTITIDIMLTKARKDFSRWTITHQIYKNTDTLSALLTVDGAWLDVVKRKIAIPPAEVTDVFNQMPKATDFQWLD